MRTFMVAAIYPYILFAVALYSVAVGLMAWRGPRRRGMQYFSLLLFSAAWWAFGRGMESLAADLAGKVFWAKAQYFGIATLPVFWLLFALDYTRRLDRINRWLLAALWLIPLATLTLVLTNERHGLVWGIIQPGSVAWGDLTFVHGPWFWLATAYGYLLIGTGMLLLVRAAFNLPGIFRAQSFILAGGAIAPLACNLLYLTGLTAQDLTPVGFGVTGIVYGWNILHYQFLDLIPVARAKVVDDLRDGVLILDPQNRIVDLNPSARTILGVEPHQDVTGSEVGQAAPRWGALLGRSHQGPWEGEVSLPDAEEQHRSFKLSVSPLNDRKGSLTGRLIVMHDVTARKAADQRLLESEARFRMLLETAPAAIMLTDTAATIIQANRHASELFGYRPGELAGRPIRKLIPGYPTAIHEEPRAGDFSQTTRPSAASHELTGRQRDGREIDLALSYSPLITTDGIIYTNIVHDMTLLRRSEEQLRLQGAALDAAANGIVVTDAEGVILWVNPAFSDITGYLPPEVLGKTPRILASGIHEPEFYRDLWDTVKSGNIWRGEITNRRKGGDLYIEYQTISPVFDEHGKIGKYIAIQQDVTAQKRAELDISQRARELAIINEIGQAAASNLDLMTLLDLVGDKIRQKFEAWMVYIALLDEESKLIEFPYCVVDGQRVADPQPLAPGEGLTSIVFRDATPLLIDENYAETADRLGAVLNSAPSDTRPKTWIGVPISAGERVIGVLSVQDASREHAYSRDDLNLLTTIAANLGVAIQNARLYQNERERRAVAETLQRVSAAITASLERDEVLAVILEQLGQVVEYDSASIMEWDEERSLRVVAHIGFPSQMPAEFVPTPDSAPNVWEVISKRGSLLIADTRDNPGWVSLDGATDRIRSWIGIPLIYKGEVMGVLSIDSKIPNFYTERDIRIASIFADQVAIAIENAHLYGRAQFELGIRKQAEESLREANRSMLQQFREISALQEQLQEQALRDPITGLYNRRFLNESLPREIARAERDRVELGVIMLDLDHFKRINDAYGHIKGDRALVALAGLLNAKTRSSDIACRYGGDEFCLILPGATLTAVAERAEELRAAFEEIEIQADGETFHVTISLGASIFPLHGSSSEELLSRADQALYSAKQAGRNRVVIGS